MRWQVEQRMKFISETLMNQGYINRKDIMQKFGVSLPQASIDLRQYQEILPESLSYNPKLKRYENAKTN